MKVYVLPCDTWGCGHYRSIFPAQVLQELGHDVEVLLPGATAKLAVVGSRDRAMSVLMPEDADVVVMQRPAHLVKSQAVHLLRARGVAVVVDVDDDLAHIHPGNTAFHYMHPKTSPKYNWTHVARACRDATLVTVTTPALARIYGTHGRVRVLPNYVPERFLKVEWQDEGFIGWPGSLHSHPDDLGEVAGALQRLSREGERVGVIGSGDGVAKVLGVGGLEVTGEIPFEAWPEAIARLRIGVAPLADTRFNSAKSHLKPLELAAVGVPFVASPRVEYRRFVELGVGRLAEKPKDWYRELRRLAESATLRAEQSAAGREVAAQLTYEAHAWKWMEAWADALAQERSTASV